MRHLAAYLMLVLGGNASPSADDVKTALSSVGVEADDERLNALLTELEGKDLDEVIAAGREKLASVGGAVAAAGAGAAGGAAAGGAEAAAAEEEEEEEEEEIDLGGGGMDMFGDEGGDY